MHIRIILKSISGHRNHIAKFAFNILNYVTHFDFGILRVYLQSQHHNCLLKSKILNQSAEVLNVICSNIVKFVESLENLKKYVHCKL